VVAGTWPQPVAAAAPLAQGQAHVTTDGLALVVLFLASWVAVLGLWRLLGG
jgi:hypothetical protein